MGALIDDLLKLSRIGRGTLQFMPVDLSAMAQEVCAGLQTSQRKAPLCSIQPGIRVTADAGLMRVLLENLLGNAAKYSSRAEQALIDVGATPTGEGVEFFIRDNGVGFDMAYADKLFQPFQRLHSEREVEGTGVGLATVARIVQRHGGSVRATSVPNLGSTFFIHLPIGEVHP